MITDSADNKAPDGIPFEEMIKLIRKQQEENGVGVFKPCIIPNEDRDSIEVHFFDEPGSYRPYGRYFGITMSAETVGRIVSFDIRKVSEIKPFVGDLFEFLLSPGISEDFMKVNEKLIIERILKIMEDSNKREEESSRSFHERMKARGELMKASNENLQKILEMHAKAMGGTPQYRRNIADLLNRSASLLCYLGAVALILATAAFAIEKGYSTWVLVLIFVFGGTVIASAPDNR